MCKVILGLYSNRWYGHKVQKVIPNVESLRARGASAISRPCPWVPCLINRPLNRTYKVRGVQSRRPSVTLPVSICGHCSPTKLNVCTGTGRAIRGPCFLGVLTPTYLTIGCRKFAIKNCAMASSLSSTSEQELVGRNDSCCYVVARDARLSKERCENFSTHAVIRS
jgi:hypothetical protein